METWEAIRSRRNVRSFTDQPILGDHLDEILEAGRRAPSALNWQPWDFVEVDARESLEELAKVAPGAGYIAGAAVAVALVATPVEPGDSGRLSRLYFDLGQVTMSMMLAAAGLRIGSGHAGVNDQHLARKVLGLPADKFCPFVIAFGYPADRALALIRHPDRRPLNDVVHRGHW